MHSIQVPEDKPVLAPANETKWSKGHGFQLGMHVCYYQFCLTIGEFLGHLSQSLSQWPVTHFLCVILKGSNPQKPHIPFHVLGQ